MAHTINLRTNELGYIKLYDICDQEKVILLSNIVVPDFNVCTNTRDTTTINTRYKPHRIVKDSHLKDTQLQVSQDFLYYATQSYNDLTCSYPAIPQIRTIFDFICTNIRLYNNICNYYHTLSKYKPHKVDTDSHSIDAVIFTALIYYSYIIRF